MSSNPRRHGSGSAWLDSITDFRLSGHPDRPGSILVPDHVVTRFHRLAVRVAGGCIELRAAGGRRRTKYPTIAWKDETGRRRGISGHRLALLIEHGPFPPASYGCHRCTNTRCVNAAGGHLYVGSPSDNQVDRYRTEATVARTGRKVVTIPLRPRPRFMCEAVAA